MPILTAFITDQLRKAGANIEDPKIKDFLALPALAAVEVPEEVVTGISNNLISIKDAKNNHPEIKGVYTAQAYDGIDSILNELLDNSDYDDATKAEIKGEPKTTKRIPLLVKKIKELETKKAGATTGDKAVLQKQIDELHTNVRLEKERSTNLEKEFNQKLKDFKIQNKMDSLFTGHKTVYDSLPIEAKAEALRALLNKQLQDNGAMFTFDEQGNFALLRKDNTSYYGDNNQLVTPQQYIETLLSRNKLLVTNPAGNGNDANNTGRQQNNGNAAGNNSNANQQNGGGNTASSDLTKQLINEALGNLDKNSAVKVM